MPPVKVIYYYRLWQNHFEDFDREGLVSEWHNRLPTLEELDEKTRPYKDGNGTLLVIDDWMTELNDDIVTLFTTLCHANRANTILLTQNAFSKTKGFRDISLSATYMAYFRNPRDQSQIVHLAKQVSPHDTRFLEEVYRSCTSRPYSYLLIDFHQKCPPVLKFRSHMFPNEGMMRCYQPKTCSDSGRRRRK